MRIWLWVPSGHISSVMMPVNACLSCAAETAAATNRLSITGFITPPVSEARNHEVSGGRPGIHHPHAAHLAVIREPQRLRRCPWNGHRHVRACTRLILAPAVIPDRSVLRLWPRAILFSGGDGGLPLGAIGLGFKHQVLLDPIEVAHAAALHRERILSRKSRAVEAHQSIGAFPQRRIAP